MENNFTVVESMINFTSGFWCVRCMLVAFKDNIRVYVYFCGILASCPFIFVTLCFITCLGFHNVLKLVGLTFIYRVIRNSDFLVT
jgi:hypothetical protein